MMSATEEGSEPPTKKLKSDNSAGVDPTVEPLTTVNTSGMLENSPFFSGQPTIPSSMYSQRPLVPSVIPSTSGNIRPSLHVTQPFTSNESLQKFTSTEMNKNKSPLNLASPIAISVHQNWTSDGKVTLQFPASASVKATQSKPPFTFGNVIVSNVGARLSNPQVVTVQNNRLTSPTSILSKPLVSSDVRGQFPVLSKHGPSTDTVKMGPSTQISFQVPVNWNVAGSKSLLDTSGKMSIVSFNSAEGKSLLTDKKNVISDTAQSQAAVDNKTVVTVVKNDTMPKNLVAGSKVFTTIPGQIITSAALYSVPRNVGAINTSSLPQKISKQGSFVISNKQYTIVPANSSQKLKADNTNKINKAKFTMAEAQIMLPSGPAKISWPIAQQKISTTINDTSNKQILITTPLMKSGSLPTGKNVITTKAVVTSSSPNTTVQLPKMAATAKVVEVVASGKSNGANTKILEVVTTNSINNNGNGSKPVAPVKAAVLQTQKSWELVKQASQLMPPVRISPSAIQSVVKIDPVSTESDVDNSGETTVSACKGQTILNDEAVETKPEEAAKCVQKVQEEEESSKLDVDDRTLEKPDDGSDKDSNDSVVIPQLEPVTDEVVEESMEVVDAPLLEPQQEPENKDGDLQEDFDPVNALDWKDGIGELPGSNLKFRVNDLGVLDVINHDLECNETLNTSNESETAEPGPSQMEVSEEVDVKKEPVDVDEQTDKQESSQQEVSNKDEITQCENCGEYGFATDFYKEGRFCSQTCVGAYDSKRMRGVKKHGTMSKMVLDLKKGRKKMLLKDSLNREHPDGATSGGSKKSKAFVWTRYLETEKATEAPARLFKNPFPSTKNNFRVGMKFEGVDPHHQSLFCVLTVVEVCGYRIRLHFDGYSECFDFWSDIDSAYIYPMGFCEKNNKALQPPKGFAVEDFSWVSYLKLTKATPAPKSVFSNQPVPPVTPNLFRVGSKLEAVDKKNSSLICVASVADTLGDKVLIHFDSWDDNYDYWCDMTAPYIHPCGFCEERGYTLSPPIDWKDPNGFTWERFLAKSKCQGVPARAFKSRPMVGFEPCMKVEVVDRRNPLLVRVASIMEVENYLVKIHFDGWSDVYDYWLDDDSQDIHPPGWCAKTGHPLVPPIGPSDLIVTSGPGVCPTPGCKGIGHIKGPKYSGHHSTFGCPYSEINMNKEGILGDRLVSYIKSEDGVGVHYRTEDNTDQKTHANNDSSNPTGKTVPPLKLVNYSKFNSQENGVAPKKFGRGRRPKSYYLELEEQRRTKEKEQERQEKEETLRQGIHNSVFSSAMVPTPKTEVPLCWDQHSKLLPGVTNIRGNDVSKWTIEEVASFVNTLPGCEEQAKLFKEQQIDGEAFLLLNQADIVKIMNIKLGPALKIFNSIIMFKNSREV